MQSKRNKAEAGESKDGDAGAFGDFVILLACTMGIGALLVYPFESGSYVGALVTFLVGVVGLAITACLMRNETRSTLPYGLPIVACGALIVAGCLGGVTRVVSKYAPDVGPPDLKTQVHQSAAAVAREVEPELAGCEYVDKVRSTCEHATTIRVATKAIQLAPAIAEAYHVDEKVVTDEVIRAALAGLKIQAPAQ